MYICVCNAITDKQVRAATEAGAVSWREVHAHHGHIPQCGKCEYEILYQIRQYSNEINSSQGERFENHHVELLIK